MISVAEARKTILAQVEEGPPQLLATERATGLYLARAVHSSYPLPFFSNSAMDGYAVVSGDTAEASQCAPVSLKLVSVISTGSSSSKPITAGQAAQIFTGAMIPPGADAVIRQEDTNTQSDSLIISRPVSLGENIRKAGEEMTQGQLLLGKGARLTPAAVGALTGAGIAQVEVISPPNVGIITTGSELVPAGDNLLPGKIFNSNGPALAAAIIQAGAPLSFQKQVSDNRDTMIQCLTEALAACEIVLVTGGVSVGKFDFVKDAAAAVGVEPIFWKVNQKPGKPLFFGKAGKKYLFGLPGNPASALVCFYEYVIPLLQKFMGAALPGLNRISVPLAQGFSKKAGLTHFLKGAFTAHGTVEILERQGSHMMTSFARANCLVVIPEEVEMLEKGEMVEIHLLPQ